MHSLMVQPPPSQSPCLKGKHQLGLFFHHRCYLFQNFTSEIIQYVFSLVKLFKTKSSRFCVICSQFLLTVEYYSIVWTYQFVHSSADSGHLGCFQFGATMNNPIQVVQWIYVFISLEQTHVGVELLGHGTGVYLLLYETARPLSKVDTASIIFQKVLQLINSGYQGQKLRMTTDLLIIRICIVKIQTMVLLLLYEKNKAKSPHST